MSSIISKDSEAIIPPSSVFLFWPGIEPPVAEEIRLRLQATGDLVLEPETQAAEGTVWSFWFEPRERPISYLVWSEPVMGEHLALLDQVRWRSEQQRIEASECRWLIGLEGMLSPTKAVADYQFQLRLAEELSNGCAPITFDASSLIFRVPEDVRHLAGSRTPPRTNCLYGIHRVATKGPDGQSVAWLHTHGLERAGAPDLEIFGVPESLAPAACEMIDAVADLWLEFGAPDPETPFAIGRDLQIAWRPWQAFVAENDPAAGGFAHRRREPGHAGYRAVLVAPTTSETGRRRWKPPLEALSRLTRAETTLFKTPSESRRMARLARERWGTFGTLFASRRPADWRFAIKMCYPMEHDPEHGEHLWFDCLAIRPGQVRGRLVSEPRFIANMSVGDENWHDLDRLSDWRIITLKGAFDPETADALLE